MIWQNLLQYVLYMNYKENLKHHKVNELICESLILLHLDLIPEIKLLKTYYLNLAQIQTYLYFLQTVY